MQVLKLRVTAVLIGLCLRRFPRRNMPWAVLALSRRESLV
jgi:hypothetical protein